MTVNTGNSNSGQAVRYDIGFRFASNYKISVRAQGCSGCNTGNCAGCDPRGATDSTGNDDNSAHYLVGNPPAIRGTVNNWEPGSCAWIDFSNTFDVSAAEGKWPPTLKSIYFAESEDGLVMDRFYVSLDTGTSSGTATGT